MIVDSGTVSSAISKLFADNQIKTKAVATAVSGHSVIVKKISLPSMSDQELAETIQKEAAQHIPFDLADVNLDYQILSEDAGSPQMDVLLVAVKKDKILNYTNVLSMAGRLRLLWTSMRWPCRTATSTTTSRRRPRWWRC